MSTTLADLKEMIEDYEKTKLRQNQMEQFCRACIAVVTRHCEINNVECLAVPKDERFRELRLAADDGKITMAYGYADLIPQPKVVTGLRLTEKGVLCPACGEPTYMAEHNPASDHPELTVLRRECTKCDWIADDYIPK